MTRLLARLSRTSCLLRAMGLAAPLALAACVTQPPSARYAAPLNIAPSPTQTTASAASAAPASTARPAAILLPLTGPNAEVGQALLRAAQLSFAQPGSPQLNQFDTGGTPVGAATAARAAIAGGAGIILGPLTGPETNAAAAITRAAGVPMLAFTSDATQAQPGVWPLGITPAQQVRRLVLAVQAENKTRLAAILPPNPFGDALATGLLATTTGAGMPEPRILHAPATFAGLNQALKSVSDYTNRRGAIESQQRAPTTSTTPDGTSDVTPDVTPPSAPAPVPANVPPPPVDALLLGVSGDLLSQTVPLLTFYDIGPSQIRILGPATWSRDAARVPNLAGAWYAAPDPAARAGFEQLFTAKYNDRARDFTSIAFDAAGIARAIGTPQGFAVDALTRTEGYLGADGLLGLQPDGQVRRGLAIFEIDRTGAHIVQPAPQSLTAPGS